ncbi:hypothetical protein D3C83_203970 [compost metagenome]
MAALVNATQGAAFRMSDSRLKLPFTLERDERVEASSVFPLWRTWWAWALVAGLACIEWWLRRRWGLS